jgi:hypothetical protein
MSNKTVLMRNDGSIFRENEDGTYSHQDSKMHQPHKYAKELLLNLGFEEIEDDDELEQTAASYAADHKEWLKEWQQQDSFEEFVKKKKHDQKS